MTLTEKEPTTIKDLQTQEEACIQKYKEHYRSLGEVLNDNVPSVDCNDNEGRDYTPFLYSLFAIFLLSFCHFQNNYRFI